MNSPSIAASFLVAGILSLALHNMVIGPVEIVSTKIVRDVVTVSSHVEAVDVALLTAKMVKKPQ